jgi:hypothetical protein
MEAIGPCRGSMGSSEVGDMSIERLHRAALAAGFSMAAPDDESGAEPDNGARRADVPASTNLPAVIVRTPRADLRGRELLAPVVAFGTRLRGRISYLSGRATA